MTAVRRAAAFALLLAAGAGQTAAAEPWLCVDVPSQYVLHIHVRPMELCFLTPEG